MIIRPITAAQTYLLRHAVLWPDQSLAYVQLPDDDAGQHFGAFEAEELVAVISLFVGADGTARFRKFATHPAWQGRAWARRCCGTLSRRLRPRAPAHCGATPAKIRWASTSALGCGPKATFFIKARLPTCGCGLL
jgi:GNAT superfamily N-acetyltransferase